MLNACIYTIIMMLEIQNYIILHHCTVGVVGTAKAVISELSDDSTQSLGVSIISTSWGMGFIIGPAISGAISDPIGQYNLNITSKIKKMSDIILYGRLT